MQQARPPFSIIILAAVFTLRFHYSSKMTDVAHTGMRTTPLMKVWVALML